MKQWLLDNGYNLLMTMLSAGGLLGYITERNKRKVELKKAKAEVKSADADALSSMQESYNKFVTDFNSKYDELKKQLTEVKELLYQVQDELEAEKAKNHILQESYDELNKAYGNLKIEIKRK